MNWIGVGKQVSHERMARFVVGDGLARIFVEHSTFALGTSDHALHAFGDLLLGDDVLVATRRKDSRFIEQVRQIGTGEAGVILAKRGRLTSFASGLFSAWTLRIFSRPFTSGTSTTI